MKNRIIKATDTFIELISYYLIIILSSGLLFSFFEHKKIADSLWWAFVTAMTVGYGDFYPITDGGRAVAILLMHVVPLVIVPLVVVKLMNNLIEDKNSFTHQEQEEIKSKLEEINKNLNEIRTGQK